MPLFITTTSQATTRGVYALERTPPTVITASGSGTVAMVEQFPWGPDGQVYTIGDIGDFISKFAPPGMSHTGPGYLSVTQKAWPTLKVCRVTGTGAAKATCTINMAGPTPMLTLTLKYVGAAGNSVTATVAAASDGDANHFNLTVSVTGASGTTSDILENLNYSGVGADSTPDLTGLKLLGDITKLASGTPLMGTTSFATGSDGTVTSADYVGTTGAADKGIALLEGDADIDIVITADPGSALRAAVNAGLVAHADLMTDRVTIVNHDSGKAVADVQADVSSYRSLRAMYVDVWAYVNDDVDGTERITPPAPWAASVMANLSPSTSISWKNTVVKKLTRNIKRLEANRSAGQRAQNTKAGIVTLMKETKGGYTFESAVNTNAPVTPNKKSMKRTRMGIFIAKSVIESIRENTDSPNVPFNQQDEINAVTDFLDGFKRNASIDPNNLPHIVDYSMSDLKTFNPQGEIDAGNFFIPANVKISSDQERIFLSLNYGESVDVSVGL